jgi:hypothetical protein
MIRLLASLVFLSRFALALCINAGGPATPTCQADAFFTGGSVYNSASAGFKPMPGGPELQDIRFGNFQYAIPVPRGLYRVRLSVAEPSKTAIAQRVFSVTVAGIPSEDFDLVKLGGLTAQSFDFVAAVRGPALTLDFRTKVWNAVVAKIEIDPLQELSAPEADGSIRLPSGKYVDVYPDTYSQWARTAAQLVSYKSAVLTYGPGGAWVLPLDAARVIGVYRNGLRLTPGVDYTAQVSTVIMNTDSSPTDAVTVDYVSR